MKKKIGLFFVSIFSAFSFAELKTVESVDLQKYQGLWHQLALIPNSFQKDCVDQTTAEYQLQDEGLIKVINQCRTQSGNMKATEGRARLNPQFKSTSRLEVTFVKIIDWIWTFAGDYWITYIDPDYQYVLVGHPDYEYGWILARNQSLPLKTYQELEQILVQRGYDSCQFLMSSTEGQKFETKTSLCEHVSDSSGSKPSL